MSHVRRQIREAVAQALLNLPTTGPRVFQSRIRPLTDASLPCLLISTNDEQVESMDVTGNVLMRTLALTVRGIAKANADLDDTLDAIAEQVEPILIDNRLGDLVKGCSLSSLAVEFDDSLEKPVGIITLQFSTLYFTSPANPGTAL